MGDICLKHNVVIMDDEIHCDFTYPGFKFTSFMTLDEKYHNSLVLYTSPSKTFNVAGLQPANIIIKIRNSAQHTVRQMQQQVTAREALWDRLQ